MRSATTAFMATPIVYAAFAGGAEEFEQSVDDANSHLRWARPTQLKFVL
jgi:hypothetical protein